MHNITIDRRDDEYYENLCIGFQVSRITIIGLTVMGNFLLVLSLLVRKPKLNFLDRLMMNSVFCNIALVLLSIPTSMKIEHSELYPFGIAGCKLIYPVCTYLMNTCVFTYVAIAFERWIVVSKMGKVCPSSVKEIIIFIMIHSLGILTVVPYVSALTMSGKKCVENWGITWRKIYTISLFLLQYGIPVPILTTFYIKTWYAIHKTTEQAISSMTKGSKSNRNKTLANEVTSQTSSLLNTDSSEIIKRSSTFPKSLVRKKKSSIRRRSISSNHMFDMQKAGSIQQRRAFTTLPSMQHTKEATSGLKSIYFLRRYFGSKNTNCDDNISFRECAQFVALKHRNKQMRIMLFKFTIIMLVFVICTLPHQVIWLMIDFKFAGNEHFSDITLNIAHLVTYANCVINPLLYGQYNRKFRRNVQRIYQNVRKNYV